MTKTLRATYDGKVFHPDEPVELKPDTHVLVLVETSNTQLINEKDTSQHSWSNDFFKMTYGMFKDDPLVREPQSPYETRDDLK